MKIILTTVLSLISLSVAAVHYNNCTGQVSGQTSQCTEDIAWSNAKNGNVENGVGKVFILPQGEAMNIWLFEKNYCKAVHNTGIISIGIPVNTLEEFKNFSEDALDQDTEDNCSGLQDNTICGDPSPAINCVQQRIYYPNLPLNADLNDPSTYYCDGATETYTYEQVILKERHANQKIYCMSYETRTNSVTRSCYHCKYANSWSPGNGDPEGNNSTGGGGGTGGQTGGSTGNPGNGCPNCPNGNTGGQTGGEGWGNPSGGSVGKKAKG